METMSMMEELNPRMTEIKNLIGNLFFFVKERFIHLDHVGMYIYVINLNCIKCFKKKKI